MRSRPDQSSISPPQTHYRRTFFSTKLQVPLTLFRSKFFCGWTSVWTSIRSAMVRVMLTSVIFIMDLQKGEKNRLNKNSWSKMVPEHRAPPTWWTGQSGMGMGSNKVTFHGKVSQCGKIRRAVCLHMWVQKVCAPWDKMKNFNL